MTGISRNQGDLRTGWGNRSTTTLDRKSIGCSKETKKTKCLSRKSTRNEKSCCQSLKLTLNQNPLSLKFNGLTRIKPKLKKDRKLLKLYRNSELKNFDLNRLSKKDLLPKLLKGKYPRRIKSSEPSKNSTCLYGSIHLLIWLRLMLPF